jgi:hypothetical protein
MNVHLHHSSKIKRHKEVTQNSRNQGFSYYFFMMMEGSEPLTNADPELEH